MLPCFLLLSAAKLTCFISQKRDKSFFEPFFKHYDVVFLDDFKDQIKGINPNFYGMLDQLIASKGRVFFGTFFSTLSGYVNRMRGYYIAKHRLEGYEEGTMVRHLFLSKTLPLILPQQHLISFTPHCVLDRNLIILLR